MDPELKKLADDVAEIRVIVKKIKGHFIREEIYSWLKIFLFIVPLIVGTIYLMPLMEQAIKQYQGLLGFASDTETDDAKPGTINISPEILKQIEALQKK